MFGLVDRLLSWLEKAAADELDPDGEPLHPPVTYGTHGPDHAIVIRANTPSPNPPAWFGSAHLTVISPTRVDITGWSDLLSPTTPRCVAAAILLTTSMPFEYPDTLRDLLSVLDQRGVSREMVMLTLRAAAIQSNVGSPLYVVVGTPMRGIRGSPTMRQHLAIWHIAATFADGLRNSLEQFSPDPWLRELGDEVMKILWDWTDVATVGWCRVYETRSEVTERRDRTAAMTAFHGKRVAVWGCGALGSHVAEWLVRAGVAALVLRDGGRVSPGILVRQAFDEGDIDKGKAEALAERLQRIRPSLMVEHHASDLLAHPLSDADWSDDADVVLDMTGSEPVLAKLEERRRHDRHGVALASLAIDSKACRGLIAVAMPNHTGGPADVVRAAKLAACSQEDLKGFADAFWPRERGDLFFPELGCSSPTFIGSGADVASLAALMLNIVAHELKASRVSSGRAHFVCVPNSGHIDSRQDVLVDAPSSSVLEDPSTHYQVRLSTTAWREMRAWIARSKRTAGPEVETGGVLFGERDDALRIIWVDEVLGPAPDSIASASEFVSGVRGLAEAAEEKNKRGRGSLKCVGLWHTHPRGVPIPSDKDIAGMWQVVRGADPKTPKALLLIVGGEHPHFTATAKLFRHSEFDHASVKIRLEMRRIEEQLDLRAQDSNVALALSGGGSRAIAFHLGCLRALHDLGVLEKLKVLSAVSGGSVIAAMYAYSDDSFERFERRVVILLRRGLTASILRQWLLTRYLPASAFTALISGSAAAGASLMTLLARVTGMSTSTVHAPFRRWVSRTSAFEGALRKEWLGERRLSDERRGDLEVIFNACELRTGSAFRFGSTDSWCSRFGRLRDNQVSVAKAVAASAAYPVLLPALDEAFDYIGHKDRRPGRTRTVLTDGGTFDNLGLSCLEPGRSEAHSYRAFKPDYIISCDAGTGIFEEDAVPYFWPGRMVRSFQTALRKNQDSWRKRLHVYHSAGALKGFVLAYLGQQDARLPYIPADLVRREEVMRYPTNFAPMREEDIDRLAARGEALTRLLIAHHCPGLGTEALRT